MYTMSISNNNFRGSRKPTKKVCDENKTKKERNDGHVSPRNNYWKEVVCMGAMQKDRKRFEGSSDQLFLTQ